jgi:hypothetical protein
MSAGDVGLLHMFACIGLLHMPAAGEGLLHMPAAGVGLLHMVLLMWACCTCLLLL